MIIKVAQLEARRNSIKKLLEQYDIKDGITYENGNTIYLKTSSLNVLIPDYQDYIHCKNRGV